MTGVQTCALPINSSENGQEWKGYELMYKMESIEVGDQIERDEIKGRRKGRGKGNGINVE